MKLKFGKILETASLNSEFSGLKKNKQTVYFDLFTFEKIWNLLLLLI